MLDDERIGRETRFERDENNDMMAFSCAPFFQKCESNAQRSTVENGIKTNLNRSLVSYPSRLATIRQAGEFRIVQRRQHTSARNGYNDFQ